MSATYHHVASFIPTSRILRSNSSVEDPTPEQPIDCAMYTILSHPSREETTIPDWSRPVIEKLSMYLFAADARTMPEIRHFVPTHFWGGRR
jgi:hypothetical protein